MKKIICDRCGNDMSLTDDSTDWRMQVRTMRPSLIESDKHFCSIRCLHGWIEETHTPDELGMEGYGQTNKE